MRHLSSVLLLIVIAASCMRMNRFEPSISYQDGFSVSLEEALQHVSDTRRMFYGNGETKSTSPSVEEAFEITRIVRTRNDFIPTPLYVINYENDGYYYDWAKMHEIINYNSSSADPTVWPMVQHFVRALGNSDNLNVTYTPQGSTAYYTNNHYIYDLKMIDGIRP